MGQQLLKNGIGKYQKCCYVNMILFLKLFSLILETTVYNVKRKQFPVYGSLKNCQNKLGAKVVTYRCRKENNINVLGKHDDNFFPNHPSFCIIYIMHFIKYNLFIQKTRQKFWSIKLLPFPPFEISISTKLKNTDDIIIRLNSCTHSMSRIMSAPLYSMDRNISVVIIRQLASGLMLTSPVRRPTSNFPQKSLYFWLLIVFIGAVQMALVQCCIIEVQSIWLDTC